jgi:chloramphenicol 3-O phosphotransferase
MDGRLILINGASSSGKSTVARALQKRLDETFLVASVDTFVHNMLDMERHIAFDPPADSPMQDWFNLHTLDDTGQRSLMLEPGTLAKRFIFGMHAAVAGFVSVGNNLIFDDVLYDPAYLENYVRLLNPANVLFVGLRCPLDVLEQRERARGNRAVGHARGHFHLVHQHGIYDLEVDTSLASPEACADQIAQRLYAAPPTAFHRLREQFDLPS